MQLYIWGPAFRLPSIDPECLAVVAYLKHALPPEQWQLIVAHDATFSPNGELPCLIDHDRRVGGLSNIFDHVSGLTSKSKTAGADAKALEAHIHNNAKPLLFYALYNSSNYTSNTRPAWHKIMKTYTGFAPDPCADRYILARKHITALGLVASPLDDSTDTTAPFTPEQQQEARMISSSPSLLFRKRQSVQAALRLRQSQNRFRLEALVDNLLKPIDAMLRTGEYLVPDDQLATEGPTQIDALAFGYLALLIYPDLSNNMLVDMIKKKYSKVINYIERLRSEYFDGANFGVETIMNAPSVTTTDREMTICGLPFRSRQSQPTLTLVKRSTTAIISRFLRPVTQQPLLHIYSSNLSNHPASLLLRSWTHPLDLLLTVSGPILALAAWFTYTTTHSDLERNKYFGKPQPKIKTMGPAGDMLAAFPLPTPNHGSNYTGQHMQQTLQDTPPPSKIEEDVVEVRVEARPKIDER